MTLSFTMISSISLKADLQKDVRLIYLDIYVLAIFLQFSLVLVLSFSVGSTSWHDAPLPELPSISVLDFLRKGPLLCQLLHSGQVYSVLERDTLTLFHPDHATLLFLGISSIKEGSLVSCLSFIDFCSLLKVPKFLL